MQINRRTCNAVSKVKTLVSWRQTEGTRHTIHFLSVTHWHLRMLWQLLSFMRTECTRCKSVICDVVVFLFFSFILAREWTQVQMCISVLRIRLLFSLFFFFYCGTHLNVFVVYICMHVWTHCMWVAAAIGNAVVVFVCVWAVKNEGNYVNWKQWQLVTHCAEILAWRTHWSPPWMNQEIWYVVSSSVFVLYIWSFS